MIEIRNRFYTQRFFARKTKLKDLFFPVTYTQYEGDVLSIPFFYKKIPGESITLDLTQDLNNLWKGMKSNTRNEIKRAEKEGCEFEYNFDYESFVPFYNEFCISKNLNSSVDVQTLAKYDKTIITQVKHDSIILAKHATVVNKEEGCALLLYSCSMRLKDDVDRKLIGWGNRFLHWKEFEYFQSIGISRYEWNGVCTDPEQQEVYKISQFKMGFGGDVKNTMGLRSPLFVLIKNLQKMLHD